MFLKYHHIDKIVEMMAEMGKQAVHLQRGNYEVCCDTKNMFLSLDIYFT